MLENNLDLPAKTIMDFLDTYGQILECWDNDDIPEVVDKEGEASLGSEESLQDDNEWQASAIKAEYYPKCPPPDEETKRTRKTRRWVKASRTVPQFSLAML